MLKIKKILAWSLVLIWMSIIFYLSHQPATQSDSLSMGIVDRIINTIEPIIKDTDIHTVNLNYIIRKTAHFGAYLILGILVVNAISKSQRLNIKWIIISIIICLAYAISDEIHQGFIPGRGPSVSDVLLDTLGSITGVIGYKWIIHLKDKETNHI